MSALQAIDIFPTLIDLVGLPRLEAGAPNPTLTRIAGLPRLPSCQGLDQPPTVECLQGRSYASLFQSGPFSSAKDEPKQHAFSQWPYDGLFGPRGTGRRLFHMGYTVRSGDGYRLTEYVPYNTSTFRGDWSREGDVELYDYNRDPWETRNHTC